MIHLILLLSSPAPLLTHEMCQGGWAVGRRTTHDHTTRAQAKQNATTSQQRNTQISIGFHLRKFWFKPNTCKQGGRSSPAHPLPPCSFFPYRRPPAAAHKLPGTHPKTKAVPRHFAPTGGVWPLSPVGLEQPGPTPPANHIKYKDQKKVTPHLAIAVVCLLAHALNAAWAAGKTEAGFVLREPIP